MTDTKSFIAESIEKFSSLLNTAGKSARQFSAWSWKKLRHLPEYRRPTVDIVILLTVVAVSILVTMEVHRDVIILEPLEVPEALAVRGYTGRVVARKLIDRLNQIREEGELKTVNMEEVPFNYMAAWEHESADIQMQGGVFSIRTLAAHVEKLFGIESRRISGEITLDEVGVGKDILTEDGIQENTKRVIRVATRIGVSPAGEHKTDFLPSGFPTALDKLLCEAAIDIYKQERPLTVAVFFLRRDPGRSEEVLLGVDPLGVEERAQIQFFRGRAREYLQDYGTAEYLYRESLNLDPELLAARARLASFLILQKRFQEASVELDRLENSRFDSVKVQLLRGRLLLNQGQTTEAAGIFEAATKAEPENPYSWFWLGRSLARGERLEAALLNLERANQLKPDFAPILQEKVRVLRVLGRPQEVRELQELQLMLGRYQQQEILDDCFRGYS